MARLPQIKSKSLKIELIQGINVLVTYMISAEIALNRFYPFLSNPSNSDLDILDALREYFPEEGSERILPESYENIQIRITWVYTGKPLEPEETEKFFSSILQDEMLSELHNQMDETLAELTRKYNLSDTQVKNLVDEFRKEF